MKRNSLEVPVWTGSSSGSVTTDGFKRFLGIFVLAFCLGIVAGGWIANPGGAVAPGAKAADADDLPPDALMASVARVRQKLFDARAELRRESKGIKTLPVGH